MLQAQPYDYDSLAAQPTPRELEVLELICEGHSLKDIANALHISIKTAACHRANLLGKSRAKNSIQLFRRALKHGYVRLKGIHALPCADFTVKAVINNILPAAMHGDSMQILKLQRFAVEDLQMLQYVWRRRAHEQYFQVPAPLIIFARYCMLIRNAPADSFKTCLGPYRRNI